MTIAAGFVYRGGVLLCSDTQQEGGTIKFHGAKIGHFECPGGKFAFAFAGNVQFAVSAIQKCSERLCNVKPEDTITELEEVLDREYRRVVYGHPDYASDESLTYKFLIAFWQKSTGTTSLFVTNDNVMLSSFENFQAIGSGFELAAVLSRPFMYDAMGEDESLILAAYVLARVKDNMPGCGGESQFLSVRDDGSVTPVMQVSLDQIASIAAAYDKSAHTLLFSMVKGDESNFALSLDAFTEQAKVLKEFWRKLQSATPKVR